jgi:hypothetical protein
LNKLYKRGEFHCLNNNLNFFQNDGNLWSIFFKLNIENFKWLLKAIIFQIDPNKFPKNWKWTPQISKIIIWSLKIYEIYKLTPCSIFKFDKKIIIYKSCPKMITMNLFITPSKQKNWKMKESALKAIWMMTIVLKI